MIKLQTIGLLLIVALGFPGCHSKKEPGVEEQMIKTQNEQISKLIDISKKQTEQIAQLASELEAERNTALTRRPRPVVAPEPPQANMITGAAYMTRAGGGSTIVRDMQVMLLNNAQIRWNTCLKAPASYAGFSDFKENQLRSDLAQFAGNVADLISAQTTTDADGKYSFQNVPPGDYFLFAQYSDAGATICWFIPVQVAQTGASLEVNLANSTAYATAYRESK